MTMPNFPIRITVGRDVQLLVAIVAVLAATACGSSSTGPSAPTGSLTVTIATPGGVTPAVTVSGPGGYSRSLSATTTLTGLAAGSYTITAAPVTTAGAIVGTVNTATVSGSPATVSAAVPATASATYAQRGGSGGLWVANHNTSQTVAQYTGSQLASTTSAAPATTVNTGLINNFGVAFDANGNLWVSTYGQSTIQEYSPSQLSAGGTPVPILILSQAVYGATGVAFDASGNLWVVGNSSFGVIVRFTPAQLAAGGNPTPSLVITMSVQTPMAPNGIAFDSQGNLWVSSGATNTLLEYTAAQITAPGVLTPAITLTANGNSIDGPLLIAFDPNGNLWVANGGNNSVVAFSAGELATSGSPTPSITLTANAGSLDNPAGLAFDASGNLWVSNMSGNTVVEFAASQLAASGSPTPSVTVSGASLNGPVGLAFDPHASNLPLK